jgi:glyoxylase-like metal-dependent hydrolase (beta-lactamase superfamily II)
MKIKRIGRNITGITFDTIQNYLTSVFLIEKASKIYLIDTFCGSDSMKPVLKLLNNNLNKKEVVVINTHFHWDHIWGNCSFKENNIISHSMCRELSDKFWEEQIRQNGEYISGKVEKCLPNITFDEKIFFENDGIELFHSPGHTIDSISIFDHEEKILYVGDNLEKPIIYVENEDIPTYIKTLENYLTYSPKEIVGSHTISLTKYDIFSTIQYLKDLLIGKEIHFESEYVERVHRQNMSLIHNQNKKLSDASNVNDN